MPVYSLTLNILGGTLEEADFEDKTEAVGILGGEGVA